MLALISANLATFFRLVMTCGRLAVKRKSERMNEQRCQKRTNEEVNCDFANDNGFTVGNKSKSNVDSIF